MIGTFILAHLMPERCHHHSWWQRTCPGRMRSKRRGHSAHGHVVHPSAQAERGSSSFGYLACAVRSQGATSEDQLRTFHTPCTQSPLSRSLRRRNSCAGKKGQFGAGRLRSHKRTAVVVPSADSISNPRSAPPWAVRSRTRFGLETKYVRWPLRQI